MSYKLFCEVHIHPEPCEFGQLSHSVSVLHRWTHTKMQQHVKTAPRFHQGFGIYRSRPNHVAWDASNFPFSQLFPTFENVQQLQIILILFSQI